MPTQIKKVRRIPNAGWVVDIVRDGKPLSVDPNDLIENQEAYGLSPADISNIQNQVKGNVKTLFAERDAQGKPLPTPEEGQAAAAQTVERVAGEQQQTQGAPKLPPGIDMAYVRLAQEEAGTLGQPEMYGQAGEMELPGYPGLTTARYMASFYRAPKGGMVATQKALIAAGYLKYDEGVINGDPFDGKTRDALMALTQDAIMSGARPEEVLRFRTELAAGNKPGMLKQAGQERAAWEQEMRSSYEEAWGYQQMMPEGYLGDKAYMNPEELAVFERSKVMWQKSGVAQEQQDALTKQLYAFFNKPPTTGTFSGFGAVPGNVPGALPGGALGGAVPAPSEQSIPRQTGAE